MTYSQTIQPIPSLNLKIPTLNNHVTTSENNNISTAGDTCTCCFFEGGRSEGRFYWVAIMGDGTTRLKTTAVNTMALSSTVN